MLDDCVSLFNSRLVAVTIPVPPNKALPVTPNVAPTPILACGFPISNLPLCVLATFVPSLYRITQSAVVSNLSLV